jgi:hypothetical protein
MDIKSEIFDTDCGKMRLWLADEPFRPEFIDLFKNIAFHLDSGRVVKDSRSVKAVICGFGKRKLFIKRYNDRGLLHRAKYAIKTPRSLNALRAYLHLAQKMRELFVPIHIAALTPVNLRSGTSFSVQEAVEDSIPAIELYKRSLQDETKLAVYIERLSRVLALLHGAKIIHGDCKLSNICAKGNFDHYLCGIWDLDVAKIANKIIVRSREKELARLVSSFIEIGECFNIRGKKTAETAGLFSTAYNNYSDAKVSPTKISSIIKAKSK